MHPWAPTNSCVYVSIYVVRASFYVSISFMLFLNVCVCVSYFTHQHCPHLFLEETMAMMAMATTMGMEAAWELAEMWLNSCFFISPCFLFQVFCWETLMVKFMFVTCSFSQYVFIVILVLVLDILVIVVVGVAVISTCFCSSTACNLCAIRTTRLQWSLCRRGSRQVEMSTTTVVSMVKLLESDDP